MGLFNGLEIAKRGISSYQVVASVIGNNISNADTDGYSRQSVRLGTTEPVVVPTGSQISPNLPVGTGVQVQEITRVRDSFLDRGIRDAKSEVGRYTMETQQYEEVEIFYSEPSDSGLSAQFDKFFESWNNLASPDPSNSGARAEVRSAAIVLADSLRTLNENLREAQTNANNRIIDRVATLNSLATSLANVNFELAGQSLIGSPNDLLDQRDRLIEEISQIIDVDVVEFDNLTVNVSIGGTLLVSGVRANTLSTQTESTGEELFWTNSGASVTYTSGEIFGLKNVRDVLITPNIASTNTLATRLIAEVNAVHTAAYDQSGTAGLNFFTGSTAADIAVNVEITSDLSKIAASSDATSAEGNGTSANAVSLLRDTKFFASSTQSFEDFYIASLTTMGSGAGEAGRLLDNQTALLRQLNQRSDSVKGVSIDEEMADLVKFERAMQAITRYMGIINGMIEEVLGLARS